VGTIEGVCEGLREGVAEGDKVGLIVGTTLGLMVGRVVGAFVNWVIANTRTRLFSVSVTINRLLEAQVRASMPLNFADMPSTVAALVVPKPRLSVTLVVTTVPVKQLNN
jgi:hypothetical protein